MRRVLAAIAVVGMIVVVVIGLTQASGGDSSGRPGYDLPEALSRLQGAPQPLAALHSKANTLVDGGKSAFDAQLASLKGHPVVINKWASWCVPCRAEFGVFEAVGTERGKEIAFLGVNANDSDAAAKRFLSDEWLPFPSFKDPDEDISQQLEVPKNAPMTVFVDKTGKTAFIHPGQFKSKQDLNDAIDKYLQ